MHLSLQARLLFLQLNQLAIENIPENTKLALMHELSQRAGH